MTEELSILNEQLGDADADVVFVVPLAGIGTDAVAEWMEDFCERLDDDSQIMTDLPALKDLISDDQYPRPEDLIEWVFLSQQTGFLFYAEWNIRDYITESAFASGPGRRRTEWFYADDMVSGFRKVIAAAEAEHAKSRAKFAGGAA